MSNQAPVVPGTSDFTALLIGHKPSRWRSLGSDAEILRCCGKDFGRLTGRPRRIDPDPWALWAEHVGGEHEPATAVGTRELATILAALRHWQATASDAAALMPEHFDEATPPLDSDEIDALCEQLNQQGEPRP